LSIPEDIAVVSFDNDEIAAYLRPGLTTVALPHEEMGRAAVELLLSDDHTGTMLVPMPVVGRHSVPRRALA
jgi:LacI family transcriptional regulator